MNPEAHKELLKCLEMSRSGYGGIDKRGRIVDRREVPTAVPIAENPMFSVPKPKPK